MNHVSYSTGTPVELEADYVVVGSGAGGATAAVSLARTGASVVLVEAGAWRAPVDYPHTAWGGLRDLMYETGAVVTAAKAAWPVVQAQTVGGTTVVNSAICVRTPADIFAQWERECGVGGQAFAEEIWRYQDQLEDELSVQEVPKQSLGRMNELALIGGDAQGIEHHVMRRYVKDCEGAADCMNGCRRERKQSLNHTFVPEMLRLGGTLLSCAPADKVLLDGDRAVGVTGRFRHPATKAKGARYTVRARRAVFVACSVTRTPLLLAASGIRNKALGEGFRSHPGAAMVGLFDDPVNLSFGATQGWASMEFRDDPGLKLETLSLPPELLFARLPGAGRSLMSHVDKYPHYSIVVHAIRAESVGRIRRWPWGTPRIHYALNKADLERARRGFIEVAKNLFSSGAKVLSTGIHGLPQLYPDELSKLETLDMDPRRFTYILSHLFGGAMMGSDPTRSVCDPKGRVHGVRGLYVADASQIPSNLGVNPQHTIMALARMRAHHAVENPPPAA